MKFNFRLFAIGLVIGILFVMIMINVMPNEEPKKDIVAIETAKSINYTTEQIKGLKGQFKALEDKLNKAEDKQKELQQDFSEWRGLYKQLFK
jgi:uncharacterized protein YoxC